MKTSKTEQAALDRLAERREEAAQQLAQVRTALRTEVGWFPQGSPWVLPLAGLACGLAIAFALRRSASR